MNRRKENAMSWDNDLTADVSDELFWDPKLDSITIAVSADDGTITLRGTVGTLRKKREAQKAAQRVFGVISGDLSPDAGEVRFDGRVVTKLDAAVRCRPDHLVMSEPDLHRIEDELGESWLREWLEQGLATLEAYLAKHAAFVDYLEAEPS